MNRIEKELYNAIEDIIWREWNPIGVNEIEEARDEYHSYLSTVFRLLKEGKNEQRISDYLYHTSTVNMGLIGNRERDDKIAKSLILKKLEILK